MSTVTSDVDNLLFAEFLDDFFAECDEHLMTVRSALLALEPFIQQPHVDRALLDDLFRGFHSLKGLAGMVGVGAVEQLAHQMESYLRALRQEQVTLSAEALDAIIAGTRLLEQAVSARRTATSPPDIGPVLARLAALVPDTAAPSLPVSAPQSSVSAPTLTAQEQAALAAAHERHDRVWLVTFVPTPELAQRDINVNNIRSRLQAFGQLIRATPRVIPTGGIAFEFLIASPKDEATLAAWQADGVTYAPYPAPDPVVAGAETDPSLLDGRSVAPSNVVRVDLARLDELMQMVGALVISRARLEDQLARIEPLLPVAEWRALQETAQAQERQLRDLRTGVMRVRMVPIGEIFARMQFVVRDLARELNKQIVLKLRGQDTEIDKFIVERLLDPLLHLVRNAVSHGLEMPAERVAAGKSATGTIRLSATTVGDQVTIDIEDDGRGIDANQIAARARALRLIDDGEALDETKLLRILCMPGFSTREQADRVSGRGVGMDVVYKTVQELGGTLALATEPGRGTHFTIQLPLTLAILDALIVMAGGQTFAVPLPVVREVIRFQPDQITVLEKNEILPYHEGVLPIVRLTRRFGLAETTRDGGFAFVIGSGRSAVGITVERLLGKREIVVRPINDPLAQVAGIAAATELGDGRVVLILDTAALTRST